jgi:hypothetical protein
MTETIDRLPERTFHFASTRREKFKRNMDTPLQFSQVLVKSFPLIGVKKTHTFSS